MDDPRKPEFASWQSFTHFRSRVQHNRRYVWPPEIQSFLDTVVATIKDRDVTIREGMVFYRAQIGVDVDVEYDDAGNAIGEVVSGFHGPRMIPPGDRARQGRVNPPGIPALYVASKKKTAISEVRPWVGSDISVAEIKILRQLRAIDLSKGHGQIAFGHLTLGQLEGESRPDAAAKEKAVWIDIDCAFSRPVTASDDAADYVPTQILAELFNKAGYDAVIYRSQFDDGYNVALFNLDDAQVMSCAPFQVKAIDVQFEENGNAWYSRKYVDETNSEKD